MLQIGKSSRDMGLFGSPGLITGDRLSRAWAVHRNLAPATIHAGSKDSPGSPRRTPSNLPEAHTSPRIRAAQSQKQREMRAEYLRLLTIQASIEADLNPLKR